MPIVVHEYDFFSLASVAAEMDHLRLELVEILEKIIWTYCRFRDEFQGIPVIRGTNLIFYFAALLIKR